MIIKQPKKLTFLDKELDEILHSYNIDVKNTGICHRWVLKHAMSHTSEVEIEAIWESKGFIKSRRFLTDLNKDSQLPENQFEELEVY